MKAFAVLLLSVLLAVGLVGGALAQSSAPAPGSSTSNPETKPDNPTDSRNDPAPASPGAQRDQKTTPDVRSDRPGESPSALPRSTESRGILGLSPTMLVLIGAALFVVVVLALVSMTRNPSTRSNTHIDYDPRP
jgi:hypothetical protein